MLLLSCRGTDHLLPIKLRLFGHGIPHVLTRSPPPYLRRSPPLIGTHVSKVKSIELDSWTESQVEEFSQGGNDRVNVKYEAAVPAIYKRYRPGDNTVSVSYLMFCCFVLIWVL